MSGRQKPGVAELQRLIAFLREAHDAPFEKLQSYVRAIDELPEVPVHKTDVTTHVVGRCAVRLVKQLGFVQRAALPALRCSLLMVSDTLAMHAEASGFGELAPPVPAAESEAGAEQPYWNKD